MTETTDHPIRLRNTLTRRVERLIPADPKNVRMYVCGPTVYDRAHLGNARSAVVFDVLFRLLRHVYGAEHVTYVRNITDIDDKIIARAQETGRSVESITEETTRWYHEDMDALGCLRPTHEPRATEYLPQMIAMIEALLARGHAYEASGHVLFAVESYRDYGRLSGRSTEDMIAGARVEVAPFKRSPADFVLWKPSGEGIPGWDSRWGRGRPGWHIECSAMARDLLGGSFDIHGGGLDLQFPHHENEIAQSRCAHPEEGFARVWVHNEMLRVEGEKMSKSLGNFFTVRDMLDRGVPGEVIRLVLLGTHYGKPLDWTEKRVEEARSVLRKAFDSLLNSSAHPTPDNIAFYRQQDYCRPSTAVVSSLSHDLNTASAIKDMQTLTAQHGMDTPFTLIGTLLLLGLLTERTDIDLVATTGVAWVGDHDEDIERQVMRLLFSRQNARSRQDYSRADAIRDQLAEAGVVVEDRPHGPQWSLAPTFDRSKLEAIK